MKKKSFICKRCASCCRAKILVTIADLHRIARFLRISDQRIFERYVYPSRARNAEFFILRKRNGKACIFLTKNKTCGIYKARPTTCVFYACDHSEQSKDIRSETKQRQRRLWEYSFATGLTKRYIKKHGAQWADDYDVLITTLSKQRRSYAYTKKIIDERGRVTYGT